MIAVTLEGVLRDQDGRPHPFGMVRVGADLAAQPGVQAHADAAGRFAVRLGLPGERVMVWLYSDHLARLRVTVPHGVFRLDLDRLGGIAEDAGVYLSRAALGAELAKLMRCEHVACDGSGRGRTAAPYHPGSLRGFEEGGLRVVLSEEEPAAGGFLGAPGGRYLVEYLAAGGDFDRGGDGG